VLSVSFLRLKSIEKKKHFVCSGCGKTFKISKYKMLVTRHYFSKLYFKCPYCNQKSWMRPEND
jgi:DNA-directed RNA polymerase subunit RPC12/RpoP